MACDFPTCYHLYFDGNKIGTSIVGYIPKFSRFTAVSKRQNFWATSVILDGRYPAILWEHQFKIYDEQATHKAMANKVYDIARVLMTADPKSLLVKNGDSSATIIDLGLCYLDAGETSDPQEIMMYEAGIYSLSFLGATAPSVS